MVSAPLKDFGKPPKQNLTGFGDVDGGLHPVAYPAQVHELPPEGFCNSLLAQTHPKDALHRGVALNKGQEQACLRGDSRSGGEYNLVKGRDCFQRYLVVPVYFS